jgi:hypothetical protein
MALGIRAEETEAPVGPVGLPLPAHARVVVVKDPDALDTFNARSERVQSMVARGISEFTGKSDVVEAWRTLVSTQDTVGIKVHSAPGPLSGTRPAVVEAVVKGLLEAGVPAPQIVIWDKRLGNLRLAGYFELARRLGVRVAGSAETGYDDATFYDVPLLGRLVWGDHEFGKEGEGVGRKSFVSKLVTQGMTKIVHITPLLNHNLVGVSGNLLGLSFGSVDNTLRFEAQPAQLAQAIPEIYALPALGDRVVLNIVDALLCQYLGEERMLLHHSAKLHQLWFSKDPVALDVLAIQELDRQRQAAGLTPVKPKPDLYQNASLLQLGVSELKNIEVETAR